MTTFRTTKSISRRALLPLIAATALSPALLVPFAARAQGAHWQIYRREDLGLEVEMPGEPRITVKTGERGDFIVRSIDAVVDVDQTSFSASFQEYRRPVFAHNEAAAHQLTARIFQGRIAREIAFTMNGFDGRELAIESAGMNGIMRFVMVKNRRIMLFVLGERSIHGNAAVRRFLDSLKLLP